MMKLLIVMGTALAAPAAPFGWTEPVEVRHEETLCLSYRAKLDGPYLVVRVAIEPGWHTFAMDNKQRVDEKLAGKKALAVDKPTSVTVTDGLEAAGPWFQSQPKDFSQPELRLYGWGFEREAVFVTKVRRSAGGTARLAIRGQACTETTCKNIDVAIPLPLTGSTGNGSEVNLAALIQVRQP